MYRVSKKRNTNYPDLLRDDREGKRIENIDFECNISKPFFCETMYVIEKNHSTL